MNTTFLSIINNYKRCMYNCFPYCTARYFKVNQKSGREPHCEIIFQNDDKNVLHKINLMFLCYNIFLYELDNID